MGHTYDREALHRRPSHPGALLADMLPDAGMTVSELAHATGIPLIQLASIINEDAPITANVAEKIGTLFGDGPEIWLRMQIAHDEWMPVRDGREE